MVVNPKESTHRSARNGGSSCGSDHGPTRVPPRAAAHGGDPLLSVTVVDRDPLRRVVRIAVRGEIDVATVDLLADAMAAQIAAGCRELWLDLADVDFCGAAGLQALLDAHRAFAESGATMFLTDCSRIVVRCLNLTGLDRVFNIA